MIRVSQEKKRNFVGITLVMAMSLLPTYYYHYSSQIFFAVLISTGALISYYANRFRLSGVLFFSWLCFSAISVGFSAYSPYLKFGFQDAEIFSGEAAKSLVFYLLTFIFLITPTKSKYLVPGFFVMALFDSFNLFFRQNNLFFDSTASDGTIIALLLPIFAHFMPGKGFFKFWPYVLFLPTIIVSSSSTSWAVYFVGLAVPFILSGEFIIVLVLILASVFFGRMLMPDELLKDNGRFVEWKMALTYLRENFNLWTGSGSGSFELLGPHIQVINHDHNPYFIWLHNDWLQVYYEQGWVGLILMVGTFLDAFYLCLTRFKKSPWLLASLLAFSTAMVTQMPWRYLPSSIIGAIVLKEILSAKAFSDEKIACA